MHMLSIVHTYSGAHIHWNACYAKFGFFPVPGCQQRYLEPCVEARASNAPLAEPLAVVTGAAALPHPEKVEAGAKAVSRRHEGWAGEDAYFCSAGRCARAQWAAPDAPPGGPSLAELVKLELIWPSSNR